MHILHTSKVTNKEKLFGNQELLKLMIISCVLIILKND